MFNEQNDSYELCRAFALALAFSGRNILSKERFTQAVYKSGDSNIKVQKDINNRLISKDINIGFQKMLAHKDIIVTNETYEPALIVYTRKEAQKISRDLDASQVEFALKILKEYLIICKQNEECAK